MSQVFEIQTYLDRIREFLKSRGYTEVITPYLLSYPNLDENIFPVECSVQIPSFGKRRMFLHTSPEYSMKKILARFKTDIFQICHTFRNFEEGRLHDVEFLMLEYYKVGEDYLYLMEELSELLQLLFGERIIYRGREVPNSPEKVSLTEAFKRYLGFEPDLSSEERLKRQLEKANVHFEPDEDLETLFFRAYVELEKFLGFERPTFIYDFPEPFGALARCKNGLCERFELYIFGVELANGYTEINDPDEVKGRLLKTAKRLGLPIDPNFVEIHGRLPDLYAGVSVGLDRLLMLLLDLESIHGLYYRDL